MINKEVLTADEALSFFEKNNKPVYEYLKKVLDETKDHVVFTYSKNKVKFNDLNKRDVFPKSFGTPAFFPIVVNGSVVNFRYISEEPFNDNKNVTQFTPRKLYLGATKPIDKPAPGTTSSFMYVKNENKDLIVFWALHPKNESSPFHDKAKHSAMYYWRDFNKESSQELEAIQQEYKAIHAVMNLSDKEAVLYAKGYGIAARQPSSDEARAHLMKIAKANPAKFINDAIDGGYVKLKGQVASFEDRGLITRDRNGWYYEDGSLIVSLPSGVSQRSAAIDVLVKEASMDISILMKVKESAKKAQSNQNIKLLADALDDDDDNEEATAPVANKKANPIPEKGLGGSVKKEEKEPETFDEESMAMAKEILPLIDQLNSLELKPFLITDKGSVVLRYNVDTNRYNKVFNNKAKMADEDLLATYLYENKSEFTIFMTDAKDKLELATAKADAEEDEVEDFPGSN